MCKIVTLLDEAITLMESLRRFGTVTNGLKNWVESVLYYREEMKMMEVI